MASRINLLLLFFIVLSLPALSGAPKKTALPKFLPPPIVTQVRDEKPQVVETGEFSSLPFKETNKKPGKSSNTSVSLVSEKDKKFFWKPSPLLSSTIRTADLTGAAISPDGTLLVISERIGGDGKANSTRLIFFDLAGKKICGGFTIREKLISQIQFLPGSKYEIAGIRSAFAPYKVKAGLVRIDLKKKKITASADLAEGAVKAFAFNSGKIFFTKADDTEICILPLNNFKAVPEKLKTRISDAGISAAGDKLFLYGQEGLEIFRLDDGRWIPDEKICQISGTFVPVKCFILDPALPSLCLLENYGGTLCYFRGNAMRKIKERISGIAAWDGDNQIFFAGLAANSRVSIIRMPEANENERPFSPNRLKPVTRNGSFDLLRVPAMKNQLLQIDNRGNVFLLEYSKKGRWKKWTVYIADRSGFR